MDSLEEEGEFIKPYTVKTTTQNFDLIIPLEQQVKFDQESLLDKTGIDRRQRLDGVTKYPFNSQVPLKNFYKGTMSLGTGSVIDDYCVLTVAHNIIKLDQGENPYFLDKSSGLVQRDNFFCGFYNKTESEWGWIEPKAIFVSPSYLSAKTDFERKEQDFALLCFKQKIIDYVGTKLEIDPRYCTQEFLSNYQKNGGGKILIGGFPADKVEVYKVKSMVNRHKPILYKHSDKITSYGERLFGHGVDTTAGQSGSAMIINVDKRAYLVGVHAYGTEPSNESENSGVRLIKSKRELLEKWIQTFKTI